jgi:DNA-binding response OmpR family regulator
MARVLCTGVDELLVQTRVMILAKAGHEVTPALSEEQVLEACRSHRFDVAVLGQVISPKDKLRIFDLVRAHCPAAKVLELYTPSVGKVLPEADDWLEVPTRVPQNLAERVKALAERTSK